MHGFSNVYPDIIDRILDMKPDMNKQTDDGYTTVMLAIEMFVELDRMLDLPQNINLKNTYNSTALTKALDFSLPPEIINRLLDMGANINIQLIIKRLH